MIFGKAIYFLLMNKKGVQEVLQVGKMIATRRASSMMLSELENSRESNCGQVGSVCWATLENIYICYCKLIMYSEIIKIVSSNYLIKEFTQLFYRTCVSNVQPKRV